MAWGLAAPLSRTVALPGAGANVVLAGGLDSDQASDSGIYDLDTATGVLTHLAELAAAVHDAAGAVVAGRDVVFGGGSSSTISTVQSLVGRAGTLPAALLRRPNQRRLAHPAL